MKTFQPENDQPLLEPSVPSLEREQLFCFTRLIRKFQSKIDFNSIRKINRQGLVVPECFMSNKIDNSKANILTFIPRIIYNNFKHFINLYFLVLAILQFFPPFKVGFLIAYILPIGIILLISFIKDFIDERQIRKKDEALNSELYA